MMFHGIQFSENDQSMIDLNKIQNRVLEGERINQEEAIALHRNCALTELGALADERRKQKKARAYDGRGNEIVTYIVDRNINYTNVCNVYCKFCNFYRTEKDDDSYILTREQIDGKID